MAGRSRPSATKRQKETARQQKQNDKRARRIEKKEREVVTSLPAGAEDPDLQGIRPGPQPPPAWKESDPGRS